MNTLIGKEKWLYAPKMFKILRDVTGISMNNFDFFLRFVISVMGDHCLYSPRTQRSLSTLVFTCGLWLLHIGLLWLMDFHFYDRAWLVVTSETLNPWSDWVTLCICGNIWLNNSYYYLHYPPQHMDIHYPRTLQIYPEEKVTNFSWKFGRECHVWEDCNF
jgi:hypothetical protein